MSNFSVGVGAAWQLGAAEAIKARQDRLEPLFLLIGICSVEKLLSSENEGKLQLEPSMAAGLRAEWNALAGFFTRMGVTPATLRHDARTAAGQGTRADDGKGRMSRSDASRAAFLRARDLAEKGGASSIYLVHLFAGLLEDGSGPVAAFLAQRGVDVSALTSAVRAGAIPVVEKT
jgi:ATP-dependent Clp protease ATP-binding subunit ClpA